MIGTVTQEVPSLVTPSGIADLEFGDPVDAINRVAAKIKAGKLADVIIVENHDGAGSGAPDGATLDQEVAAGGPFAKMVQKVTPDVAAIFNGHTHKQYAWDAPVLDSAGQPTGRTRPIVQTGNYGEFIGQIQLTVDTKTMSVTGYKAGNVQRTTSAAQPGSRSCGRLPAGRRRQGHRGQGPGRRRRGGQPACREGHRRHHHRRSPDPRLCVMTGPASHPRQPCGGLPRRCAQGPGSRGAEIGVVNPGGLRNELYYAPDGTITYAEANSVLPFVNNLWTTTLTGRAVQDPAGAAVADQPGRHRS